MRDLPKRLKHDLRKIYTCYSVREFPLIPINGYSPHFFIGNVIRRNKSHLQLLSYSLHISMFLSQNTTFPLLNNLELTAACFSCKMFNHHRHADSLYMLRLLEKTKSSAHNIDFKDIERCGQTFTKVCPKIMTKYYIQYPANIPRISVYVALYNIRSMHS